MYTKEYSKDHKRCWADLVENMYEDIKKINEENLESVQAMKSEFKEESDFFKKKLTYISGNQPNDRYQQNEIEVEKPKKENRINKRQSAR
jgi:hypothetical protein